MGNLLMSECVGEECWATAAFLKRKRAFADLSDTTGWSIEQIAEIYESEWASKGMDFHRKMLQSAVEGGHLFVWHKGDTLVGYAATRLTNLCKPDGPPLWITGDLLIDAELPEDEKRQIAKELVEEGRRRGAVAFEFLCDASACQAFLDAGMFVYGCRMRLHLETR